MNQHKDTLSYQFKNLIYIRIMSFRYEIWKFEVIIQKKHRGRKRSHVMSMQENTTTQIVDCLRVGIFCV